MSDETAKILRISNFPTRERTGMGMHAYQLSSAGGFHTEFLTIDNSQNESRLSAPVNTTIHVGSFYYESRAKHKGRIGKLYFWCRRFFSILRFSVRGVFLLFSRSVNIVHVHSPMFIPIVMVARLFGKRVVITYHGSDFHRLKASVLYRRVAPKFDTVFAISPDMVDELRVMHPHSRVVVIPNGVDRDVYKNLRVERRKSILAVGSLKEEKGFKYLISAFSKFLEHHPDYRLDIAGEGVLRTQLVAQASEAGVADKVIFHGHLGSDSLVTLFNQCEVFVLSSVSEGFPKVLLEAMACGCKVVATKVGSVESVLGEYEYLVEPADDTQLALELQRVVASNPAEIIKSYERILERCSWDRVRNIYQEEMGRLL